MPHRKKKRGVQHPRLCWIDDDTIQLLAFLDHCLEFGLNFESLVASHLAEVTGKAFSNKQISAKLKREWKGFGRLDSPAVDDLLIKGSCVLVYYDAERKERIRDVASHIDPPGGVRDRSGSAAPSTATSRSRTLSKPRQRSESSSLSSHATSEFEGFHFDIRQADRAEVSAACQGSMWDDLDIVVPRSKKIKGEVHSAPQSTPGVDLSMPAAKGHYVDAASQCSPWVTSKETRAKDLERKLAEKSTQFENAQREHTRYVFTLSNRLSAAERECDEVRHSARSAAAHMNDFVMQRNLRQENYSLKDQLAKVQKQQRNFALAQTNSLGPTQTVIQDEFDQIKAELANACSSLDIATLTAASFHEMQVHDDDDVVESWTSRLADCNFSQLVASAMGNKLSEFDVIRALAAVGICDMAFESDFPSLIASESPLLDQYRSHILTAVGPQTLFQLDLVAHQSLMTEPHFDTHYIEHVAGTLAGKLCRPLSRLIASNTPATEGISSGEASPARQRDDSDLLSETFIQPFAHALQLKAKLLLSPHKYKLIYFRPGDRFHPDRMVLDVDTFNQPNPRKRGKRPARHSKSGTVGEASIKLCLFPALYSIPGETNNLEHSLESGIRQCLVSHRKFVADDIGEAGEGVMLVVKAVVLI